MSSSPLRLRFAAPVLCALLVCAASPLHAAPEDKPDRAKSASVVTQTLRLRHLKPSQVAAQLLSFGPRDAAGEISNTLPTLPGVESLSADDSSRRLTVRGDKAGIARLREMVSLLDQPAPQVRLQVAITSAPYVPGDDSVPKTKMLASTKVEMRNMDPARIPLSAGGVAVQSLVQARVNGDRSVTLIYTTDSRWRASASFGIVDTAQSLQSTRRLKVGEVHRVTLTASAATADANGKRRQFYLELTPVMVKVP